MRIDSEFETYCKRMDEQHETERWIAILRKERTRANCPECIHYELEGDYCTKGARHALNEYMGSAETTEETYYCKDYAP